MRPTILRVDMKPEGAEFRSEPRRDGSPGLLARLALEADATGDVFRWLFGQQRELGDRFYVIALTSANSAGGLDIMPSFIASVPPHEAPSW